MLIESLLRGDFASVFSWIIGALIALTVHEYAHAKVADLVGDPTPRGQGRVTLNPLAHYDPLGTTLFLIGGIGWGKPVPINPRFFRKPRRDEVLVSVAGAVANVITAVLFGLLLRVPRFPVVYVELVIFIVLLNLILALFNLIPIYPLDGSHVLVGILPPRLANRVKDFYSRWGMISLIAFIGLLWMVPGAWKIIWIPVSLAVKLLTGHPLHL